MYPLQCKGGYAFPIQTGMKSIAGIMATVSDPTAASRLKLIDSDANKIVTDDQTVKTIFCDLKGVANSDGIIGVMFPEAIKVRNGVAITSVSSNLVPGSVFVYVR